MQSFAQIPVSPELATVNENARSALDCGRGGSTFLCPLAHEPKSEGGRSNYRRSFAHEPKSEGGSCRDRSPRRLRRSYFHTGGAETQRKNRLLTPSRPFCRPILASYLPPRDLRQGAEGVKKSNYAITPYGQPLWLPEGGHEGRPYDPISSQLRSLAAERGVA